MCALISLYSSNVYVRYLLRLLTKLMDVFGFRVYAIWVPTHTNWIEDGVGRLLEVLAARTQDELVAAAAPFYARLMSDHRMLSVEPLKAFLRGNLAPMAVLCDAVEAERANAASEMSRQ